MSTVINPTPGRVVWFFPAHGSPIPHIGGVPLAATVAYVHENGLVNLAVTDMHGASWPQQDVRLVQEGQAYISEEAHAEWMPYQIGQAKAAEAPKLGDAPVQTSGQLDPVDKKTEAQDEALAAAEANLRAQGIAT